MSKKARIIAFFTYAFKARFMVIAQEAGVSPENTCYKLGRCQGMVYKNSDRLNSLLICVDLSCCYIDLINRYLKIYASAEVLTLTRILL